jgi:hypothetical protein
MIANTRLANRWRRGDERGEALPVAILFLGVFFTVLVGVHLVIVAVARSAVQSAADRALVAAQAGEPGDSDCDGDGDMEPDRVCRGVLEARLAMLASRGSVIETRLPAVAVQEERGTVTVLVFGGVISPVLGGVELTGQACGPLDSVAASGLTAAGADLWRC